MNKTLKDALLTIALTAVVSPVVLFGMLAVANWMLTH